MNAELFKPLNFMFNFFKVVGMWQDGNQTWTYFVLGYFIHVSSVLLVFIGQLICAYKDEDFIELIETLGLTFTYLAIIFKSWNFFYKIKTIKKMFETLTELVEFSADHRWKTRNQLRSQIFFGFKVHKVFWTSAWTTCVFASMVPFVSHKLPYKVWFPFDTETSEIEFWTASSFLIVNGLITSVTDISLDTLPVFFMVFAIGLTNELSDRLAEIGKIQEGNSKNRNEKKVSEDQKKEIVKCIEVHLKIKEFVDDIQKNFSTVILIQGFISSLILCLGAFSCSTTSDVSVFFRIMSLMVPMVLEIFLPCYFGNEMSLASSKLSTALFHSNWYIGDQNLKSSIKMFMENTKRGMKISAYGVFEVDLATFSRIGNSAYSLFAILQRVSN